MQLKTSLREDIILDRKVRSLRTMFTIKTPWGFKQFWTSLNTCSIKKFAGGQLIPTEVSLLSTSKRMASYLAPIGGKIFILYLYLTR